MKKRVLVTGGTGFVGANLSRCLLRDGYDVHILSRRNDNVWRVGSIRDQVTLYEADLSDRRAALQVVARAKPDWVFHCAVYGAYSWQDSVERMVQTNIQGLIHLLMACTEVGIESFINAGTSSEYGYKDHAPSELEALEPNSAYAVTKASATMYCRWLATTTDFQITTLRLYSVYGPYEDTRRLIPTLIRYGLAGKLPPLVDPEVSRDFVWVEDVYDAYRLAALRGRHAEPGAIFNVGTGVQTSVREVVELAQRIFGIECSPQWGSMPNRRWDTHTWVADNRRTLAELRWRPIHTLERGFQRAVEWWRAGDAFRILCEGLP